MLVTMATQAYYLVRYQVCTELTQRQTTATTGAVVDDLSGGGGAVHHALVGPSLVHE